MKTTTNLKKELPLIILIIAVFITSIYLYPKMPDQMPTHWNAKGEVDDYGSRFMGLFLMPIFLAGIYLLFQFLPKIMVYQKNFEQFKDHFYGFKVLLVLFFVTIYTATLLPNFNIDINMGYVMIPAISVLFFYIGIMLKHTKRNYFIGIRTPWTLADEGVWDKTHQLGSKLFKIMALIMVSSIFFIDQMMWFILVPVISLVLYLFLYSFLEYRKTKK
jgi:uncharacterized membrane protein